MNVKALIGSVLAVVLTVAIVAGCPRNGGAKASGSAGKQTTEQGSAAKQTKQTKQGSDSKPTEQGSATKQAEPGSGSR